MMFDGRTGPDPFVFYKFHHVWRAEMAWTLSEDLKLYEVFREGPAFIEQVCARTGLQKRPVAALLAANACSGQRAFYCNWVEEVAIQPARSLPDRLVTAGLAGVVETTFW